MSSFKVSDAAWSTAVPFQNQFFSLILYVLAVTFHCETEKHVFRSPPPVGHGQKSLNRQWPGVLPKVLWQECQVLGNDLRKLLFFAPEAVFFLKPLIRMRWYIYIYVNTYIYIHPQKLFIVVNYVDLTRDIFREIFSGKLYDIMTSNLTLL